MKILNNLLNYLTERYRIVLLALLALNLIIYSTLFLHERKPIQGRKQNNLTSDIKPNAAVFPFSSSTSQGKISKPNSIKESQENSLLVLFRKKYFTIIDYADSSNYGERIKYDSKHKTLEHKNLVVIHETVISADEALKKFKEHHVRDQDQSSYHILIRRDGRQILTVPLDKRAYGAGDSAFFGESVQTNPKIRPSVNNFAIHVGLESPSDGNNENQEHSGYTEAQYESLAYLISTYIKFDDLSFARITTHKDIDLSKTRTDPRSFDRNKLDSLVKKYLSKISNSIILD